MLCISIKIKSQTYHLYISSSDYKVKKCTDFPTRAARGHDPSYLPLSIVTRYIAGSELNDEQ
jgi:hypothetical protein